MYFVEFGDGLIGSGLNLIFESDVGDDFIYICVGFLKFIEGFV